MPSVTLFAPGAAEKSAHPSASHEVVNRPSVVAPSVSRARNAKIVATSSSGNTKDIKIIPPECCSEAGIQPVAWQRRLERAAPVLAHVAVLPGAAAPKRGLAAS